MIRVVAHLPLKTLGLPWGGCVCVEALLPHGRKVETMVLGVRLVGWWTVTCGHLLTASQWNEVLHLLREDEGW